MTPEFSVSLIIPCYNHAASLSRAVVSGLSQSALQEIIIVDDHSSDDASFTKAKQLATVEPRVRAIQTEFNKGPGSARNLGVKTALGSHICFLDADDELLSDWFGEALEIMATQAGMRALKGEMEFYDPVKGYVLPEFDPRHRSAVLSSSCGMLMERRAFLDMGGFPENPVFRGPFGGEDVAFMQAVMGHFQPIGRIERPCYRVYSQSRSHLDKLLANTRLKGDSFEFMHLHPDQAPDGPLAQAISSYLMDVSERLKRAGVGGGGD